MSKQVSDQLFRLVHALSPSEKRAFMLYAKRQNGHSRPKFLRLFRAIATQRRYDEKKLLKKNPDFRPVQMPNMKAHLYGEIMASLRLVRSGRSGDMRLTECLDQAHILYDKCLYRECLRVLEKAKAMASATNRPVFLLEILEMEKRVARVTVADRNEERVNSVVRQAEATAEQVRNIQIFSNLAFRLNSYYVRKGFIRSEKDLRGVNRFFHRSLPSYDLSKMSVHEKLHLYHAFTGYYFYIQDFSRGYEYARKWLELFDEHPSLETDKPEMYIRALNTVLVALNKLKDPHEFDLVYRRLTGLKRRKDLLLTENLNLNLFKAIYIHDINRHYLTGEFEEGTHIVHRMRHGLARLLPHLDKQSVMLFYYKIACLYFGSGQHREALRWLNMIIHSREGDVREDLQEFSRILALISYYELGNDELMEYQVKSLYRFLLKKGSLSRYDKLILGFLRKLPARPGGKQLKLMFTGLKEQMEKLEKLRFEKRAFLYFDIVSWLESKIRGVAIQEVVREKVRAGS